MTILQLFSTAIMVVVALIVLVVLVAFLVELIKAFVQIGENGKEDQKKDNDRDGGAGR